MTTCSRVNLSIEVISGRGRRRHIEVRPNLLALQFSRSRVNFMRHVLYSIREIGS